MVIIQFRVQFVINLHEWVFQKADEDQPVLILENQGSFAHEIMKKHFQ